MNTTFFQKYINKYKGFPVQVKASFWFLVCSFLQRGVSFITTPIYSRLLSTAEYGQYSVFNSWLSIITLIVSLNLSWGVYTQGLVKFDEKTKQKKENFNFGFNIYCNIRNYCCKFIYKKYYSKK